MAFRIEYAKTVTHERTGDIPEATRSECLCAGGGDGGEGTRKW